MTWRQRVSWTLVAAAVALVGGPVAKAESEGQAPLGFPTRVHAWDPDGRWVALCMATRDTNGDGELRFWYGQHGEPVGDQVTAHLSLGVGTLLSIDDYVASSRGGRYVVVVQGGSLLLLDTATGRRTDLGARGADPTDREPYFGPHGAASFDDAGERMAYVRTTDEGTWIVVRDLVSGVEQETNVGRGLLWRAELDASGEWILAYTVDHDSDGNGRLELPRIYTGLAKKRCRGPWLSYSTHGRGGDDPAMRVARVGDGHLRGVGKMVGTLGAYAVIAYRDGGLWLRSPAGAETSLVPAEAGGRLVATNWVHGSALVEHTRGVGAGQLWVYGLGEAILLGPLRSDLDARMAPCITSRWTLVASGDADVRVDMKTGRATPLPATGAVCSEPYLIHWGEDTVQVEDTRTGARSAIAKREKTGWPCPAEAGRVAVEGMLIDVRDPTHARTYDGRALAVRRDGRVLVGIEMSRGVVRGPLRWVEARSSDQPSPE